MKKTERQKRDINMYLVIVELVLFGTGREFQPVPQELRHYFYKLGIQVDQMNTVRPDRRKRAAGDLGWE